MIDGEVKIIDEFTGRILEAGAGRTACTAVEAKEGVRIREENQTLATITLQNYFRLYDKLAGMTGTALTEATEFMKIYEVAVVEIPTHRPMIRDDHNDQIYKTKDGKWQAVAARSRTGTRPDSRGSSSARSRLRSPRCSRRSCGARGSSTASSTRSPRTPSARARQSPAGRLGAGHDRDQHGGRGVDIKLGGDPEQLGRRAAQARPAPGDELDEELAAHVERPRALRGRRREGDRARRSLHPRHRAPRVTPDRQPASWTLRAPGRSGESRFFLSAEDDLIGSSPASGSTRSSDRLGPVDEEARVPARGDAHPDDRERAEEGRAAELPDPQAGARVRRRDERAAPGRLSTGARSSRAATCPTSPTPNSRR